MARVYVLGLLLTAAFVLVSFWKFQRLLLPADNAAPGRPLLPGTTLQASACLQATAAPSSWPRCQARPLLFFGRDMTDTADIVLGYQRMLSGYVASAQRTPAEALSWLRLRDCRAALSEQPDERLPAPHGFVWSASLRSNSSYWAEPSSELRRKACSVTLEEDLVVSRSPFQQRAFNFAHTLADLLPRLLWLRSTFPRSRVVIEIQKEGNKVQKFINWIDPSLHQRALYVMAGEVFCSKKEMAFLVPKYPQFDKLRLVTFHQSLRAYLAQRQPEVVADKVVYYSRVFSPNRGIFHGRHFRENSSKQLLQIARNLMKNNNRPETLVTFDGTLSLSEQMELFGAASLVFGPHGAGLANSLWMQARSCGRCPAVLEFICSHKIPEKQVARCSAKWHANFWQLHATAYWVQFYHVLFRDESQDEDLRVDLDGFRRALNFIWEPRDPEPTCRNGIP